MSTLINQREPASSTGALGGSPSWDQLGFILGGVAALLLGLTLCGYIGTWMERRRAVSNLNNTLQVSHNFNSTTEFNQVLDAANSFS